MSEDESATQHACGLGYLMPVSEDESACMWTRVSVGACDAAWPVRKSGVGKILYCFSPGAIRLVVDYGEVSAEVW